MKKIKTKNCVQCSDFMLVCSFTRFVSNRHSPMSGERREVVGEGSSSGKSTPNWSRMEDGGSGERGSTGEYDCVRNDMLMYLSSCPANYIYCSLPIE